MITCKHEEYIRYYEYLQEYEGYGTHPLDAGRAVEIFQWINVQLPHGAKVIDCSCGRGFLVKLLRDEGYDAEGTEASSWEIEYALKPRALPVRRLFYSELGMLPDAAWDAVVSNDVLEHLFTEAEVRAALRHLARMTKKWLLVTVGLNRAARVIDGERVPIHHVVRADTWWVAEVGKVATVRKQYRYHNSHVIFAEVKHGV